MGRRGGEGESDAGRWIHREAHAEARPGEDGAGLVEDASEGFDGARPMRRAEGSQGDVKFAVSDTDVASDGEQLLQQCAAVVVGARVVRSQQCEEVALGLVGNHLDDVSQVLALRGELDDSTVAEISDLDALWKIAALVDELGDTRTSGTELLAELAALDYEGCLTMEPHLRVGGQFGGDTGAELFSKAIDAVRKLSAEVGLKCE